MTLSDKIIEERKKKGWSQEELAYKLEVSRQAVSKWESAGSVPDLQRIIQLADLFGVSTDYLLRDNRQDSKEGEPYTGGKSDFRRETAEPYTEESCILSRISPEQANRFLEIKELIAGPVANRVSMCVISPVVLIVLIGMAGDRVLHISENFAMAVGVAFLLCLVAVAVFIFIRCGGDVKDTEYLEKEEFETEYAVTHMAKERKIRYAHTYNGGIAIGTVLCILSCVPLILSGISQNTPGYIYCLCVGVLLIVVALGVNIIVRVTVINNSFDILLQEGDFTPEEKRIRRKIGPWSGIYWCLATALYLGLSFKNMRWDTTWVVWPVARLLFVSFSGIVRIYAKREK